MAMIFLFTLLVEWIINLKCSTHFSWILGLSLVQLCTTKLDIRFVVLVLTLVLD